MIQISLSLMLLLLRFIASINACPSPTAVKPCFCTSGEQSRWVNVTCSYARSWREIRDALQPFRASDRYFIQTLYIEKVSHLLSNGRTRPFRRVRLAELIIDDSMMIANGKFPKYIFAEASWITALHLNGIGLQAVPTRSLRLLPILTELSLARNTITSIGSRAFRYQSDTLTYLDLQRNHITHVPSTALKALRELEILLLNSNRIHHCPADAFISNRNLQALELSDNEITHIDRQAFAGLYHLKHLGLAGNPLFSASHQAFRHLPSTTGLISLDISATDIELTKSVWPDNTNATLTSLVVQTHFLPLECDDLTQYVSLVDLDLKGNIDIDPDQFQLPRTLASLRRLDATETSLSIDNLRSFPNLEVLYMNSIKARRLKQVNLTPLRSLSVLHLSDCALRYVEMSAFWHLRSIITEINLSHNRLRRLKRRTFHGLKYLISLDLSYNRFRDYGASGPLADNTRPIFPLDKNLFDRHSGKSLRILSLAGNGLRRVPEKCLLHLINLHRLDLSGNRIENVQMQVKRNVNLEVLNLQNNKISYIHPDAFRTMTKLRILNLSWNQLTTINSVFFPNTLRELDVARCYLEDMKNPYLAALTRLRIVDFSNNMLQSISDRLLPGYSLIYIDLAMNPLKCDCGLQPFVEWLSANKVVLSGDSRCFWPMALRELRPQLASVCWSSCSVDGTGSNNMCFSTNVNATSSISVR